MESSGLRYLAVLYVGGIMSTKLTYDIMKRQCIVCGKMSDGFSVHCEWCGSPQSEEEEYDYSDEYNDPDQSEGYGDW